ncbi:MAG: phage terminase small subunit P27 family [Actinomycetota bacterium]|nr:phage terminase small subunit P27 family [Actinomycetota bacterium]
MANPTPLDPELRKKLGNPGKRGERRPPDGGVDKVPRPPKDLGPIGKAQWKRIWTAGATWLDVGCDLGFVTRLCQAYEHHAVYEAEVMANYLVEGSRGQLRVNPAVTTLRALDHQINVMEGTLGFTPAARRRLGIKMAKPPSKLDEFSRRRGERPPPAS